MHAIDLNEFSRRLVRCSRSPKTKSRTALSCSPEFRQEWRGKAGHVPASKPTVRAGLKFHAAANKFSKNHQHMAAMQMLHCTIVTIHLYWGLWRTNQEPESWVSSLKCSPGRAH